jgi:hypothetical protein
MPAVPVGNGHRPHPRPASNRFKFCPAAISSASPLPFSSPPQPEASKAMPRLGFGEQWLDPGSPFAHRLLVGRGDVVAADPVEVGLIEAALELTTLATGGALRLERTGITCCRGRLVEPHPLGVLGLAEAQFLAARTVIDVGRGIVGVSLPAEEGGLVIGVG